MENDIQQDFLCENISATPAGQLLFGGQSVASLADRYGTPLYLMDEDRIRHQCRLFREAVKKHYGNARVLYASKAASFRHMYEIMQQEDMGVDVVSCGEIHTAFCAGYPMENAFFHSNNKTDADIAYAMETGVGYFVADNEEELRAIEDIAAKRGITQKILLRLTPGIDPHTYAAVNTGTVDSKFGLAIETGQALRATQLALSLKHIDLCGYHCHVGSQVFDGDVLIRSAECMLTFIADVARPMGADIRMLDLGGGFGARYVRTDPVPDAEKVIADLACYIKSAVQKLGIPLPELLLEPGRSIVADAGLTVYTVGTRKVIPGYKTYLSVDGGMTDNPRFALYGAKYTVLPVRGLFGSKTQTVDLVGRCCESGDILAQKVSVPRDICRGDRVALLTTGAYHYSMASNYNRIPRPPVVMLANGQSFVAVRRETPADLTRLDV